MHALVLLCVNQYTKFEVPSFTNYYTDTIEAKFITFKCSSTDLFLDDCSPKTEFLLIGLKNQLAKIHNSSLDTSPSARNLGFTFDGHLTLSDQITSLSKACFYHIRQRRCIRLHLDSSTAYTIATSVVHSELDYCNSLSTINPLSLNYPVSSRSRILLLVLSLKLLGPVIFLPSHALH